jgi:site-specific DNA-methyltransferase (adenine-specific)
VRSRAVVTVAAAMPLARVIHGDNLEVLRTMESGSVDLVYIDPPFNTGKAQKRDQLTTTRDAAGDVFDDYLAFLEPRLVEAYRVLKPTGSLYFHIDYREAHYCKVLLDGIFGRASFLNEIVWAYDYGARTRRRWPAKHDDILFYVKDPSRYYFDSDAVDRIPYMAPGLVGAEKAARGKLPTDTWWHTIVSPTGKEKLGYPTQKPLGVIKRIVTASSPRGGVVLDFFAGSGTAGDAAVTLGRRFLAVDESKEAFDVMRRRFAGLSGVVCLDAQRGGKAAIEIGDEIARVLEADGQAYQPVADAQARRDAAGRLA